jgi:hypothetical protein
MRFELRWSDIERAKLSGRYPFRGSEIEVQARHIYAGEQDPDGVWEVSSYVGYNGRSHYGIVGFQPSAAFEQKRSANPALQIQGRKRKSRPAKKP